MSRVLSIKSFFLQYHRFLTQQDEALYLPLLLAALLDRLGRPVGIEQGP